MISFALFLTHSGAIVTRNYKVENFLGLSNTLKVQRTVAEDGKLTWSTEEVQDSDSKWEETLSLDPQGALIEHCIKWRLKEASEWRVQATSRGIDQWVVTYRGQPVDSHELDKRTARDAGDPSLIWWVSMTPKVGDQVKGSLYVPMFGIQSLKVTYSRDTSLTLDGRQYSVHQIEREIGDLRHETWYVDDSGMPVMRVFWTTNADKPNRVDRIKD